MPHEWVFVAFFVAGVILHRMIKHRRESEKIINREWLDIHERCEKIEETIHRDLCLALGPDAPERDHIIVDIEESRYVVVTFMKRDDPTKVELFHRTHCWTFNKAVDSAVRRYIKHAS